ncbi:MAG: FkbM family methyltransferase [Halorientalis sp.]
MIGTSSGKRVHLLADLVGENGSVYIFEPSPENFEAVRRAAESHENVSVDNRGAWYESAEKTMRLSAKTRGGHRVSDAETAPMPHDQYHDEHTIQVEPIDFLLDEYGVSPDYLEIAAAGTELEILRGARETLAGELRLFVKAWGVVLDSHEDHATEIESLLRDSGFQISTARVRSGIDSAGVPDGDIFAWK